MPPQTVQFTPFASLVQPAFWHELTRLKVDVLRLKQDAIEINGSYAAGRSVLDRETGTEVSLGCNLTVGSDAFEQPPQSSTGSVTCKGYFKNYNTIEDFKNADKASIFSQVASEIWSTAIGSDDPSQLNRFLLITFADLKKYKYYYWFAFPAFVAKPAWTIGEGWSSASDKLNHTALTSIHNQLHATPAPLPYFLLQPSSSSSSTYTILPLTTSNLFSQVYSSEAPIFLGFVDPSSLPTNPGWPLRNALAYLRKHLSPEAGQAGKVVVRVLCWRDMDSRVPTEGRWKSRVGIVEQIVELDTTSDATAERSLKEWSAVGWEKTPQGKLAPRLADLAPMMDPTKLADQATALNLKLMRWRVLPELDLEKIENTRCLLLGAGTLGCYVARGLAAWNIRKITFIDSGTVSFSNPVRQPLFEFEDCLNGGRPKAECAAERLKKVVPGVNTTGYRLAVPMPGHPVPPSAEEQSRKDVQKLEELIEEHDVVFLLMDSRESRWLGGLIGRAKEKLVINAALGFDSYVVMRHGARPVDGKESNGGTKLGCYYCNDVVAPADSLSDRTLDQMCTVTRPGLAAIASMTAVELMVSVLQHPDGIYAAAPPVTANTADVNEEGSAPYTSVLGIIPHTLRGFLGQWKTLQIVGSSYEKCTGCSETVLRAYEEHGFAMLIQVFNDSRYLESVTGLDKLKEEAQRIEEEMEEVDWDEDE